MPKFNRVVLAAVAAVVISEQVNASGNTAAFLKVGVGARAAAMGEAYTAVADDITAAYWNPAGLARIEKLEAGATHAELYGEARYDSAGLARKTELGVFAASVNYLSYPDIEGRDINRNATGKFSSSDLAAVISYATKRGPLNLGVNAKYLRSAIENESASAVACDVGAQYETGWRTLVLGAAVQHFGTKMKFISERESLPLTLAVGAAAKPVEKLLVSADAKVRKSENGAEIGVGGEYEVMPALYLRVGYNSRSSDPNKSTDSGGMKALNNLTGLGTGIGIKVSEFRLDYSFTPSGELGNSQRISLNVRF